MAGWEGRNDAGAERERWSPAVGEDGYNSLLAAETECVLRSERPSSEGAEATEHGNARRRQSVTENEDKKSATRREKADNDILEDMDLDAL